MLFSLLIIIQNFGQIMDPPISDVFYNASLLNSCSKTSQQTFQIFLINKKWM